MAIEALLQPVLLLSAELAPAHSDLVALPADQFNRQAPVLGWDLVASQACLQAVFAEGGDLSPALLIAHRKPGHRAGTGPVPAAAQRQPQQQGCLLYTSPSPRDRTRSRMPSSA